MYIYRVELREAIDNTIHIFEYDSNDSAVRLAIDFIIRELNSWQLQNISEVHYDDVEYYKGFNNEIISSHNSISDHIKNGRYDEAIDEFNSLSEDVSELNQYTHIDVNKIQPDTYPRLLYKISPLINPNVYETSATVSPKEQPCIHCGKMNDIGMVECWHCGNKPE